MPGKPEDPKVISKENLRELALGLINSVSTMTVATCGRDTAWAAPVYYVYQNGMFFFFSNPDSRHIQEALDAGSASVAIHAYADSWQHIRGLQMSGIIKKGKIGLPIVNAVRAYLKKFPFTKDFFKDDQQMDLNDFFARFKVHLYSFEPDLVYYQDNQIRFGFREEMCLEEK